MDSVADRARVRYVIEVWVDVDVAERSVDRVVVDTEGLTHPVDVRAIDGRELPDGPRQAVLDVLASDTWPSWDYK